MNDFVWGYSQALSQAPPELQESFRDGIEAALCDEGAPEAEARILARMGAMNPQLATSRGYECAVRSHAGNDPFVAETLEAWLASGAERTAIWRELEAASPPLVIRRRLEMAHERDVIGGELSPER